MKKVLQPSALLHLLAAFFSGLPPRRFVVVENLPFGMISGSRTEPPGYLARPYAARLYEHAAREKLVSGETPPLARGAVPCKDCTGDELCPYIDELCP